jgi:hypothetical protein
VELQRDALEVHCTGVARRLCQYCASVRYVANVRYDAHISEDMWLHYGRTAAFMAFVRCGGSSQTPTQFDWESADYFRCAVSQMQKLALGSESEVYDQVVRDRTRRDGRSVAEVSWDAWTFASLQDIGSRQGENASSDVTGRTTQYSEHANVFEDLFVSYLDRAMIVDDLVLELTRILKPQEVVWLIRKYRDNVPSLELARDFQNKDARYQTSDGLVRARRYIDVTIHRAKKKARATLTARWKQLAEEAA